MRFDCREPLINEPPDARQEADNAAQAGIGPLDLVFRRRDEDDVQAQRVGAELLIISSGSTTFPFDFDITAPSFSTIPASGAG
jgi:hypothetical protein